MPARCPARPNTVTLFADSIVEGQYATTNIHYSQGDLCAAMKNLGASLNLSAQAQSLISSRTLTTADEITGDSVTTPFWPLSKSEFEAIQAENQSLLTGDSWPYWLRTEAPSEWEIHRTVYAGDADGTLTQNSTPEFKFWSAPGLLPGPLDPVLRRGGNQHGQLGGRQPGEADASRRRQQSKTVEFRHV